MQSSLYQSFKLMENNKEITMESRKVVELINNFRLEEGNRAQLKHSDFLKSIDKEVKVLESVGISTKGNFHLSSYSDGIRNYRCYQLNKSGIMQMLNKESALVRYKTQQYIEALESKLKQDPYENLSTEMKALLMHDKKIQAVQKEVIEAKEDLTEFKEDMPLFTVECEEVARTVKRVGTKALGGKGSKAYKDKSLRAKVYSDIHKQLKREFDVNSYKAIKRRYLKNAIEIVENYNLTIALNEQIRMLNNQVVWA